MKLLGMGVAFEEIEDASLTSSTALLGCGTKPKGSISAVAAHGARHANVQVLVEDGQPKLISLHIRQDKRSLGLGGLSIHFDKGLRMEGWIRRDGADWAVDLSRRVVAGKDLPITRGTMEAESVSGGSIDIKLRGRLPALRHPAIYFNDAIECEGIDQ